jgi:hypothetical protein
MAIDRVRRGDASIPSGATSLTPSEASPREGSRQPDLGEPGAVPDFSGFERIRIKWS